MKLTNNLGLPQAVFDAVAADPYSKGESDFSVTELLSPPRQRALRILNEDKLEEDVSDRLWSLYGQLAHALLERANKSDIVEKRMFATIQNRIISGQFDNLSLVGGILSDYKFTSSWGFKANSAPKAEHEAQLNMLAYLLELNGHTVNRLQIIALLRDWSLSKAKYQKNYPRTPIVVQEIAWWTKEVTGRFIAERIFMHEEAAKKEARDLPLCTHEETWAGRRCEDYCNVNKFCSQYQAQLLAQQEVFI